MYASPADSTSFDNYIPTRNLKNLFCQRSLPHSSITIIMYHSPKLEKTGKLININYLGVFLFKNHFFLIFIFERQRERERERDRQTDTHKVQAGEEQRGRHRI